MKALTLWQPWADLIAFGEKQVETRSWTTAHRGLVAIHAAKAKASDGQEFIAEQDFFSRYGQLGGRGHNFVYGAIVATARLYRVELMGNCWDEFSSHERRLGWYERDRYAWFLQDVRALRAPVACRGMQGLWEVPTKVAVAVVR